MIRPSSITCRNARCVPSLGCGIYRRELRTYASLGSRKVNIGEKGKVLRMVLCTSARGRLCIVLPREKRDGKKVAR